MTIFNLSQAGLAPGNHDIQVIAKATGYKSSVITPSGEIIYNPTPVPTAKAYLDKFWATTVQNAIGFSSVNDSPIKTIRFTSDSSYITGLTKLCDVGATENDNISCYVENEDTLYVYSPDKIMMYDTSYSGGYYLIYNYINKVRSGLYVNVEHIYFDNFDTSEVVSLSDMFYQSGKLQSLDLSSFDTSNVTSMDYMFGQCSELTSITFGDNFDTSNVTTMANMFSKCNSLFIIDISSFDMSNVTTTSSMFYQNTNLFRIEVNAETDWRNYNITNSSVMFNSCTNLPNFDSGFIDISKAYQGEGGYFTDKETPIIEPSSIVLSEDSIQIEENTLEPTIINTTVLPYGSFQGISILNNNPELLTVSISTSSPNELRVSSFNKPQSTGIGTITVYSIFNPEITATLTVEVIASQVIYPTEIIPVQSSISAEKGSVIPLMDIFTVLPSDADTSVLMVSTDDEDKIYIDPDDWGEYKNISCLREGVATVTVTSSQNPKVTANITIEITPETIVEDITLSETEVTLTLGEKKNITVSYIPSTVSEEQKFFDTRVYEEEIASVEAIDNETFTINALMTGRTGIEVMCPTSPKRIRKVVIVNVVSAEPAVLSEDYLMVLKAALQTQGISLDDISSLHFMSTHPDYTYSLNRIDVSAAEQTLGLSLGTGITVYSSSDEVFICSDTGEKIKGFNCSYSKVLSTTRMKTLVEYKGSTSFLTASLPGLTYLDITGLDVSEVTNFTHMFYGCNASSIEGARDLDTSSAIDMSYMFANTNINSLGLNFDTTNVTTMESMFENSTWLYLLNLHEDNSFVLDNVTSVKNMFKGTRLQYIYADIDTNWTNYSGVSTDMFDGCVNLPNYDGTTDITKAYVGEGGYFTLWHA